MLRITLLLAMFIGVSAHAHWNQPPERIVDPIICKGHPGTFAIIRQNEKTTSFTIVLHENNQVRKTIQKNYPVYNLQFSPGCVSFMMDSEHGRESISLVEDA